MHGARGLVSQYTLGRIFLFIRLKDASSNEQLCCVVREEEVSMVLCIFDSVRPLVPHAYETGAFKLRNG